MNKEEAFFAKLVDVFRLEAEEHIQELSKGILKLESADASERPSIVETIFREAHSLKGAARSVNQQSIQTICQTLENVLAAAREGKITTYSPSFFDVLHETLDLIQKAVKEEVKKDVVNPLLRKLDSLIPEKKDEELPLSSERSNVRKEERKVEAAPKEEEGEKKKEENSNPVVKGQEEEKIEKSGQEQQRVKPQEGAGEKTIRISLTKLDGLFQEVEELLMVKLAAQQQAGELKYFFKELCTKEKELSKLFVETQQLAQIQMQKNLGEKENEHQKKILFFLDAQQNNAKAFRENLSRMVKNSEQNVHFVSSLVDTLLEDMKKVLMQPVNTLFDGMARMIRDLTRDLKKNVQTVFSGGEIEVDRRILEELKDPVIHLIRNAIDHGIETEKEREESKKNRVAVLNIYAVESGGNSVEIVISDDGRGIDCEKIKQTVIKKRILAEKEFEEMEREDILKLIFSSGVSTSPIITDLSGRGIGLGIVAEKVEKLGGQVVVESVKGEGTTFKLLLPLTLATFRGIHVTIGGQDFIMPTHHVKRVLKKKMSEISTIENFETVVIDENPLSYVHLGDLLGIKREKNNNEFIYIMIIKAAEKTIAFGVDIVHHEHEVLVKGLGKQCVKVKNIMGATILEQGKVVPILNPLDLIKSAVKGQIEAKSEKKEQKGEKKTILLAEDSMTTRLLLKNIIESAGYNVKTAVDGVEACEMLQTGSVELLMTDVEMPRMGGFLLTEKVRAMPRYKELPIIICTTRGSREDRERGIELGANAYLDKGSFAQQTLLSTIEMLLT